MADHRDTFPKQVRDREKRKIDARKADKKIWFGLGMFGVVGWSIALPTVVGGFVGIWLDSRWPGRYSWTLMCLAGGLALGCFTAWNWIQRERLDPEKPKKEAVEND